MANSKGAKPFSMLINLSDVSSQCESSLNTSTRPIKKPSVVDIRTEMLDSTHSRTLKVQQVKSVIGGGVPDCRVKSARKHRLKVPTESCTFSQSEMLLNSHKPMVKSGKYFTGAKGVAKNKCRETGMPICREDVDCNGPSKLSLGGNIKFSIEEEEMHFDANCTNTVGPSCSEEINCNRPCTFSVSASENERKSPTNGGKAYFKCKDPETVTLSHGLEKSCNRATKLIVDGMKTDRELLVDKAKTCLETVASTDIVEVCYVRPIKFSNVGDKTCLMTKSSKTVNMPPDDLDLGCDSPNKFPIDENQATMKFSTDEVEMDINRPTSIVKQKASIKSIAPVKHTVESKLDICTSLIENKSGLRVRTSVVESNSQRATRAILLKLNELPARPPLKRRNIMNKKLERAERFKKEILCFKCDYCPQMTLKKEMMDLHMQKGGVCAEKLSMVKCPGCANVFATLMGLRAHVQHDHNMISKDVNYILRNLHRVKLDQDKISSSCAYATGNRVTLLGDEFSPEQLPLTLQPEQNGELTVLSQDRSSCAKRPTLLESYLDGISGKNDAEDPPRLSENGPDLLENTFNFTTPVSEQLPSIQAEHPPGAADVDTALLGDTNQIELTESQILENTSQQPVEEQFLMVRNEAQFQDHSVNSQSLLETASGNVMNSDHSTANERHLMDSASDQEFLSIDQVFAQHRDVVDQNRFKDGQGNEYLCISPGIPVIHLDDKPGEEFDLSSYTNVPVTPAPAIIHPSKDNPKPRDNIAPDEHEMSEEKKAEIKKLGCGFRCNINGCQFRMQSEENIKYHRRCHEGKLYNCPECCNDCPTWISLSSHLWLAHKIDMELYKCDLCPYRTPSYSRLTGIHRGIHGTARPFLCDNCGKGFKTVKQMRNHKNIHRAKMIRVSCCFCNICGRAVADKRLLTQHINTCHNKQKPFLCAVCGYATGLKHSLIVHIRKHTGEKPHACDKCEYKSADHNALRRHKMKHTGSRNYKCSQCSYSCIQASTYKTHIKLKHPSVESELIFSCGQCNFQTLQRGKYLTHLSNHRQSKFGENAFFSGPEELGQIMSERVVETIVDLSGAQTLISDNYYEVG